MPLWICLAAGIIHWLVPGLLYHVRAIYLDSTKMFAYKDCTENGTWWVHPESGKDKAFYDSCHNFNSTEQTSDSHHRHVYIFIAGYSISLAMLLVSLFIFFKFRQLRCDRITIHKNLFISYIINGVFWILYFILAVLNGNVLLQNPVWCQVLHVVAQYSVVCNFAWMFCEGLYLHTVMMKAFTSGKWIIVTCYVTGWGKQFLCVSSAVITTLKAARATLILIPLLGLQFLLFPLRPARDSPLLEPYTYAIAVVISLQGSFVSFMYCFCNGEVLTLLKRKWNQHKVSVGRRTSRAASTIGTTSYTLVDQSSGMQTSIA
ncbi:hypothetical protein FSP39_020081 [Pinctada imbricata]|uniref:G-protein coupled receptors family 2 profile 2 domain-containing protein n=1 Tax=Pinctada imbricata TaxID=66713 RepID=A0AA89C891_PINIB|nr:hypothetical protein FSP39_020081 [Pinctada imbricata]